MDIPNLDQIKKECAGKKWWWRAPLLIWFVSLFFRLLLNPDAQSIFNGLNLGVHETGHLLFRFCGQFLCIAGGTIFQLFVPVYGMWNFYKQKDFFAICLCFGWFSTNLFNVSVYMNDAISKQLHLVSPFGSEGIIHDWNYLFSSMGLLNYCHIIAGFVWFFAALSMLFCIYSGSWILWQMATLPAERNS